MNFLLNETRIFGIKNIDKTITLAYSNKVIGLDDFRKSHIKTIYGSNGAGKSGIVHSFDVYRYVTLHEYPFKDPLFGSSLTKLINKKTKECSIGMTFSVCGKGDAISRFDHEITIALDGGGNPFIKGEKLDALDLRGQFKRNVFTTNGGEAEPTSLPTRFLFEGGASFLRQNSLVRAIAMERKNVGKEGFDDFALPYLFARFLQVCFGSSEDDRNTFDLSTLLSKEWNGGFEGKGDLTQTKKKAPMLLSRASGVTCLWAVPCEEEKLYRRIEPKMEAFLKLLKPNLKSVKLSFKRDGVFSYCVPVFHYDGYSVDYEFESTGVKKLCQLFMALYYASHRSVVVIDEIDAGIHDVFFEKLIEYFVSTSHCQIVMTTHNIGIMESVKRLRKSIDVLTDECEIVSWVSKGKSSPSLFYSRGALGGVPLNLQSFDFSPIFEDEDGLE